ncbi:MAG: hypothetical protein FJY92_04725 [Candidatus Hydrogenedentes bacterium]|nr:hypothetical protein [Candidatus Hydrogenedentota bacterium]
MKQILGAVKSRPSLNVLCMNSQGMVVRTLAVPFRGHTRVAAAVPVELEPNLAFPIDDLIIDYVVTTEAPGETNVLAVAAKQAVLEDVLAAFASAGVSIEGINLDVAGLATLWLAGQRKPAGLHAQLHVRDDGAVITITNNRRLVFFRHLAPPASPHDLSRDTRNTLRAFTTSWKGEEAIANLTVTGVELDDAAREEFEDGLSAPVLYADLARNVRGADKALAKCGGADGSAPTHNRWEAAAGVAAASAGSGVLFELRKGPLAPVNVFAGMRSRLFATAALGLITLAGAVGYCAAQYQNNQYEIERIGADIWSIYAQTFPDSPDAKQRPEDDRGGAASMTLLEASQKAAEEEASRLSAATLERPPLLDVIKELADTFPADKVMVTELKVRDSRGGAQSLTVQGEILDDAAFNGALDKLKQSAVFKVDDDPVLSTREGKTTFVLQATI